MLNYALEIFWYDFHLGRKNNCPVVPYRGRLFKVCIPTGDIRVFKGIFPWYCIGIVGDENLQSYIDFIKRYTMKVEEYYA